MSKKIEDLRDHLFATLEALRDEAKPMDIERAKAVADVSRVIIDSAKVEVEALKLIGGEGTGFIPKQLPSPASGGNGGTASEPRRIQGRDTRG